MTSTEVSLLVVLVESRRFALRLEQVEEILPLAEPAPVPGWPRYGLGLLQVRGDVVPLVDVRSTLGLPDRVLSATQKLVVIRVGTGRWGLLVSSVLGVTHHEVKPLDALVPQPRLVRPEVSSEFAVTPEGPVAVLDAPSLINTLGLPLPAEPLDEAPR